MGVDPSIRSALGRHAARFVVEELLGAGGFGRVARVFDRRFGIEVALKIPYRFAPEDLVALKREFRVLAGFSHPNVVALHELFATASSWFFTMELVRGRDAIAFLDGGRLARPGAREALAGLVAGLDALHAAGLLHGDLKPSNAWVDHEGRGVLLDFGLARPIAERLETSLAGTPAYLAPELFEGAPSSAASDAYALGVLLFEAATGHRAFEVHGAELTLHKLTRDPPRVRAHAPDVPEPLASVIDALLAREPSARPSLRHVREALQDGLPSAPLVDAPPSEIARSDLELGRRALLDRLEEALAPQPGTPRIVRFRGAPGIGKSTLLAALGARLGARSAPPLVLLGRASENETVPYALLDGAVDALARALASTPETETLRASTRALVTAFPVLATALGSAPPERDEARVEPAEARRRVAVALRAAIAHAAPGSFAVLMLDDAQWADPDGLALLSELARTESASPLSIVIAHREEGALEDVLQALAGDPIVVPPLDAEATVALARLVVGSDDAPRIARAAGGSPFLVEVLARGGAGALDALGTEGDVGELARRAVEARLSLLPGSAQGLVDVCMIAGHPIALEVATHVQREVDGERSLDGGTLRRVTDGRWIRAQRPLRGVVELAPYHDRLREIVTERVPRARRRALHLALARALEERRELDVMRLCLHYREGGALAKAASLAEVGAGEAAEQLAFGRAAELYAFALAHRDPDARSHALRVALAHALVGAGRSEEAGEAFERAAQRAPESERLDLTRRASEQFLRAGHFRRGSSLLDDVLAQAGVPVRRAPARALFALLRRRGRLARAASAELSPRAPEALDPREIARIDACASGAMGLSVVDSLRSADLMSEALERAIAHGDGRRLAVCMIWQAAFAANEGSRGEARTRAWLARGEALATRYGGDYERACVEAASALTEFHLGHFRAALGHCVAGGSLFRERTIGTLKESSTLAVFELAARAMLGELDALAVRSAAFHADADARGDRYALTNVSQGLPILRWLAADRPGRAHDDLDRALRGFDAAGYVVQHFMDLLGRVLVLLYEGRAPEARQRWEADRAKLTISLLSRTEWTSVHVRLLDAWTALALAARERGLSRARWLLVAGRSERWLAAHGCAWARAFAPLLAASALAIEGRSSAAETLARARAALAAHDLGLAVACADLASGSAQGAAWAARERVVRPERLSAVLVPGFSRWS
ncbi:MAG: serine/threonine-protein kinase [Sandaracinus sp.]